VKSITILSIALLELFIILFAKLCCTGEVIEEAHCVIVFVETVYEAVCIILTNSTSVWCSN